MTQVTSTVNGDVAQSFGSSNGGLQYTRDGLEAVYNGPAFVQTQAYDGEAVIPVEARAAVPAQSGAYYSVPPPATIVSYQNFAHPQFKYEVPAGAVSATSRATSDGNDDSSISTVNSNGRGVAIADAQSRGVTTSHAKSSGFGYGSATSTKRFNHETASTSAKTNGAGTVETSAKSNGVRNYAPVIPVAIPASEIQPAVVDAKFQPYVPRTVAAVAPAKPAQKTIGWRFGTYYDVPSNSANAQVNSGLNGYAKTSANTATQGIANANANLYNGYGAFKSAPVETNYGTSSVNADASSGASNNAKSFANISGRGNASSSSNTNAVGSSSRSTAVNTNGLYGFSRTNAGANTSGSGTAKSSAFGGSSKRADSSVSSYGFGSANANAESV